MTCSTASSPSRQTSARSNRSCPTTLPGHLSATRPEPPTFTRPNANTGTSMSVSLCTTTVLTGSGTRVNRAQDCKRIALTFRNGKTTSRIQNAAARASAAPPWLCWPPDGPAIRLCTAAEVLATIRRRPSHIIVIRVYTHSNRRRALRNASSSIHVPSCVFILSLMPHMPVREHVHDVTTTCTRCR